MRVDNLVVILHDTANKMLENAKSCPGTSNATMHAFIVGFTSILRLSNAFSNKPNGITALEIWSSGRDRSWALDLLLFALPSTFSSTNGLIKKPEILITNRPYLKLCPKVLIQIPTYEIL